MKVYSIAVVYFILLTNNLDGNHKLIQLKDGSTFLAQNSPNSSIVSDKDNIEGSDFMICQTNPSDPRCKVRECIRN